MDEYFLQFLWRFQKFGTGQIFLTSGEELKVLKTGFQNSNSGPDFKESKIKIGDLLWSGSVEIHHKSSDWNRHNHQNDPAYDNVILHVVWIDDKEIHINNTPIPTLEISKYVIPNLESEYRRYINQPDTIKCSNHIKTIPAIQISSLLDTSLVNRLQEKSDSVLATLEKCNGNWEETTYRIISKNFGFKTNNENFESLSQSLEYSILRKHYNQPTQTFALIFGMAGYLETELDDYYINELKTEFGYLSKKYKIQPNLTRHQWQYSRMRPSNFPSVRLAQLATILCYNKSLFSQIIECQSPKELKKMITKQLPDYWNEHYDFDKPSSRKQRIGQSSVENIIINSVSPILAAYSRYLNEEKYMLNAQQHLEALKSESNHITRAWEKIGIIPKSAADSQSLIYHYKYKCSKKKCLQCNIGVHILSKNP